MYSKLTLMAVIFIISYLRSVFSHFGTDELKYLILAHLVWFDLYYTNHTRIHAYFLKQAVLSNWKHPLPNLLKTFDKSNSINTYLGNEYFIPTFVWNNQEKKQSTKHSRRRNNIIKNGCWSSHNSSSYSLQTGQVQSFP